MTIELEWGGLEVKKQVGLGLGRRGAVRAGRKRRRREREREHHARRPCIVQRGGGRGS